MKPPILRTYKEIENYFIENSTVSCYKLPVGYRNVKVPSDYKLKAGDIVEIDGCYAYAYFLIGSLACGMRVYQLCSMMEILTKLNEEVKCV
jgi:hypothetical protein